MAIEGLNGAPSPSPKGFPKTPHDNLRLPSGLRIGDASFSEIARQVISAGVHGANHELGRGALIDVYAAHLAQIGQAGAASAVAAWLAEVKARLA